VGELFPIALARVEAGDPGDPQESEGRYEPFFEPEYAWIDWARPAIEIHRQVRSWRFASATGEPPGALAEVDGSTVRVLRTSLELASGREMACGDGKIWIVETESV
jgi:methionyl-tRNA formyltransferase